MKAEIPKSIGEPPESGISFDDILEAHDEFITQELNDMEECYKIMPPPETDIVAVIEASNIASL